ncbi:hypothetical protein T01_5158 [Trichinella spiralis]|uniref:Uncharacterized protein n=1 Tax=Trichinella spiralis TaxID=6334 RepID=A0A0V1BZ87_TRISP|nr:hypothetical protein T01_5158 [Trichinella spiralis]
MVAVSRKGVNLTNHHLISITGHHPANRPTSRTKHNPDKRAISLYASILLRKCPNDVTVWKTEFKCSFQLLSPEYAENF